MEDYEIDNVDRGILRELMRDARTPYTEIAKRLIVSAGTVHVRMRKLEEAGVVQGTMVKINPSRLGLDMVAFAGIELSKGSAYRPVLEELKKIPELVEAHYTTGHYGIFIKLICRNTAHLREVLNERIQQIEDIKGTETFISLESGVSRQVEV